MLLIGTPGILYLGSIVDDVIEEHKPPPRSHPEHNQADNENDEKNGEPNRHDDANIVAQHRLGIDQLVDEFVVPTPRHRLIPIRRHLDRTATAATFAQRRQPGRKSQDKPLPDIKGGKQDLFHAGPCRLDGARAADRQW